MAPGMLTHACQAAHGNANGQQHRHAVPAMKAGGKPLQQRHHSGGRRQQRGTNDKGAIALRQTMQAATTPLVRLFALCCGSGTLRRPGGIRPGLMQLPQAVGKWPCDGCRRLLAGKLVARPPDVPHRVPMPQDSSYPAQKKQGLAKPGRRALARRLGLVRLPARCGAHCQETARKYDARKQAKCGPQVFFCFLAPQRPKGATPRAGLHQLINFTRIQAKLAWVQPLFQQGSNTARHHSRERSGRAAP